MRRFRIAIILLFLFFVPFTSPAVQGGSDPFPHLWSGFATPLAGRSPEQRGNAARAAAALNNHVIPPGGIFSFNELVGARDSAKGYLEAPMIDGDGTLRDVPGGGICQLATTIYNAALLAGMRIVERHPHSRAVHYVPPGRDATVASWRKDLKFSNPHPFPILLRVGLSAERLSVSLRGPVERMFVAELTSDVVPVEPETAVAGAENSGKAPQAGGRGFSVITRRIITRNGVQSGETVSEDFYPPPSRLIAGGPP